MLDFRANDQRYRLVTTLRAMESNQSLSESILNRLKKDLSKGTFYLSNYQRYLKTPELIEHLDADLVKTPLAQRLLMRDLIEQELEEYQARVKAGTLGLATCENYLYAARLHTIPFFNNFYLHEVTSEVIEKFIKTLPFTRKRIDLIFRPLRNIFDTAMRKGYLATNPQTD